LGKNYNKRSRTSSINKCIKGSHNTLSNSADPPWRRTNGKIKVILEMHKNYLRPSNPVLALIPAFRNGEGNTRKSPIS
jgi:hypothetical protein